LSKRAIHNRIQTSQALKGIQLIDLDSIAFEKKVFG